MRIKDQVSREYDLFKHPTSVLVLLAIPRWSFFVCTSMVLYVVFVLSFFVPHLSIFGALRGLCFVIVAFPGYRHLHHSYIFIGYVLFVK